MDNDNITPFGTPISLNKDQGIFCGIKDHNGQVVIVFSGDPELSKPRAIDTWATDPAEAINIAEAITTAAFMAREDLKPVGDTLKGEIVEKHRKTLTKRVALMLNSLRENKTIPNGRLAKEIVEVMLKEVF